MIVAVLDTSPEANESLRFGGWVYFPLVRARNARWNDSDCLLLGLESTVALGTWSAEGWHVIAHQTGAEARCWAWQDVT
jgi:hypothetical protein